MPGLNNKWSYTSSSPYAFMVGLWTLPLLCKVSQISMTACINGEGYDVISGAQKSVCLQIRR